MYPGPSTWDAPRRRLETTHMVNGTQQLGETPFMWSSCRSEDRLGPAELGWGLRGMVGRAKNLDAKSVRWS